MDCSVCGHSGREGASFCEACGARLALRCARCGTEQRPAAQFCDVCGARLDGERTPRAYVPGHLVDKIEAGQRRLAGERKRVTVMFADVTGSMALAESVDPETWQRIMDRFFALLCDGVHRFEGTVNKFTGDGIMALFGAPIAHEDHARRACYSALHLRDELASYAAEVRREHGLNFSVRTGLNSGDVVVGTIGDDLQLDYTAIGHTVGLAQRIEALAEPGCPYVAEPTAKLVEGFFALRDLGRFELKGVSEPIRVFELGGVGPRRTRLDVSSARGFSRFVGRHDELATLESALAAALEGRGTVVGIVGEAGLGKSRLCHELLQRCRERGFSVSEGHGVSHGKRIPLLPILELVRSAIGLGEQEGDQATREKIAGRLLLLDDAFRDDLPLIFDFLGVPDPEHPPPRMDPEARERQLFAIGRRMVHARSRREPGIQLLEDLHWFDPVSEAFLDNNIEAVAGTRTLVLATFRPGYHARWMEKSYYRQIALVPLGDEAAVELLHDLLGRDPSLDGLADRIRERTGGNPFFIEEVVQSLAESGTLEGERGLYRLAREVDEIAIPVTVQAVLEARIDRLGDDEKAVLQTAAVIGREFTEPVLRRVAGVEDLPAALAALVDAELIYEQALYPDVEYAFKHPLTQEVAQASQLAEDRARTHAAVARALSEQGGGDDGERAALLAHHWEAGREPLEAARAHRRAAEWAGVLHPQEAMRHWEKVRDLVAQCPATPETAEHTLAACTQVLNFGWRLGLPEADIDGALAEGRAVAERIGSSDAIARLYATGAAARAVAGDARGALAQLDAAARHAEPSSTPALALVPSMSSYFHFLVGDLPTALSSCEQAIEQTREDPRLGMELFGYSPHAFSRMLGATILAAMGRMTDAVHERELALALARQIGDEETIGWARSTSAFHATISGDVEEVLERAHEGWALAERLGSPWSQVVALVGLARAHNLRGEWADAVSACKQGLAIARERRSGLASEGQLLYLLAEARLGLGDVEAARAFAEEAVDACRRRDNRFYEVLAEVALARTLLAGRAPRPGAAADALARARSLCRITGGVSMEPFIHAVSAELAAVRGDDEGRVRELREAQRLFEQIGAPRRAEAAARAAAAPAASSAG